MDKAMGHGKTPLFVACFWGHSGVVARLLQAHANVYASDDDGNTPHDAARHDGIRALLNSAMAKADARCRAAAVAVMAMHRGHGVDRHLLQVLGRMVWGTREQVEWQR